MHGLAKANALKGKNQIWSEKKTLLYIQTIVQLVDILSSERETPWIFLQCPATLSWSFLFGAQQSLYLGDPKAWLKTFVILHIFLQMEASLLNEFGQHNPVLHLAIYAFGQIRWPGIQRSWVHSRPCPNAHCVPSFPAVSNLK